MTTLAIDCATEACSVALFQGSTLLDGDYRVMGRGHAEALVPMIAALPGKGRAKRILVALGPGSFTGLRVGLAAARALGLAWDVPVLGYATHALIAAMARRRLGAQPVTVAMTGGHGEWFLSEYDAAGNQLCEAQSLTPQAAATPARCDLIAGNQAETLVAVRGSGTALAIMPDVREVLALDAASWRNDLALIYGRAPDARLPAMPAPC